MSEVTALKSALQALGNPEKAAKSARFFKTGKGAYSEGAVFFGVTMPEQRKLAREFATLSLGGLEALLAEEAHECRMTALLILVRRFQRGDASVKKECFDFYLRNTARINNWDLVDASAEFIIGPWLEDKPRKMDLLRQLAVSKNLWERRMAMLATFAYIKKGRAEAALTIARLLLKDPEDLIQKATGWMLREIGKRCSRATEETFLKKHYREMPRTMLRYAIEHFPEARRQAYLKGTINEHPGGGTHRNKN